MIEPRLRARLRNATRQLAEHERNKSSAASGERSRKRLPTPFERAALAHGNVKAGGRGRELADACGASETAERACPRTFSMLAFDPMTPLRHARLGTMNCARHSPDWQRSTRCRVQATLRAHSNKFRQARRRPHVSLSESSESPLVSARFGAVASASVTAMQAAIPRGGTQFPLTRAGRRSRDRARWAAVEFSGKRGTRPRPRFRRHATPDFVRDSRAPIAQCAPRPPLRSTRQPDQSPGGEAPKRPRGARVQTIGANFWSKSR